MKTVDVDNTLLTDLANCDTKTAVRHVLGLTTKEEQAQLVNGQAAHSGLALFLSKRDRSDRAIDRAVGQYLKIMQPFSEANLAGGDRLWHETGAKILRHHLKQRYMQRVPLIIRPDDIELAVDFPLGIVGNTKVVMVGLVDAIGQKPVGTGWWDLDHKTARSINAWWADRQRFTSQYTGYKWLVVHRYRRMVHGVYVNGLEFPELNSSDKKCPKHKVAYKKCALQHVKQSGLWLMRPDKEVAQWERSALWLAGRYVKLTERVQDVGDLKNVKMQGRFTGACVNCDLKRWCEGGRQLSTLERNFIHRPWRPREHAGFPGKKKAA